MDLLKSTGTKLKRIFTGASNKRKQRRGRASMDVFVNEAVVLEVPPTRVTLSVVNVDVPESETETLTPEPSKTEDEIKIEMVMYRIFGNEIQQEKYSDYDYLKQAHELYNYGLHESINTEYLVNSIDSYCKNPHGKTVIREHLADIHRNHRKLVEDTGSRESLIIEQQQKIADEQQKESALQDELNAQKELFVGLQKEMNVKWEEQQKLNADRYKQLNDVLLNIRNTEEERKQAIQTTKQSTDRFVWGLITYAAVKVTQMIRELFKYPRSIIPKILGI